MPGTTAPWALYQSSTEASVSALWYTATSSIPPDHGSVSWSCHNARPTSSGPDDAIGLNDSAWVPSSSPLTYSRISPREASYTPVRCVHTPISGTDVELTAATAVVVLSSSLTENVHLPSWAEYLSQAALSCTPRCDTAVRSPSSRSSTTHAEMVNESSVRNTGVSCQTVNSLPSASGGVTSILTALQPYSSVASV